MGNEIDVQKKPRTVESYMKKKNGCALTFAVFKSFQICAFAMIFNCFMLFVAAWMSFAFHGFGYVFKTSLFNGYDLLEYTNTNGI